MSGFTCKDLKGKYFETKVEMFRALKNGKEDIAALRKSAIKFTDSVNFVLKSDGSFKAETSAVKLQYGDHVFPVINSINYLDSHNDLHLWDIWNKSAEAQKGKVYFIINHDLSIGNVISYPKDVELVIREVEWSKLGKPYTGTTQVLLFKAKVTEKSNSDAYLALRDGEDVEYSIRMQYVRLELCINDSSDEFKTEKAAFDKYFPLIVNHEKATEDGFFWAIHEAKIYKEGSMVLFASNDATATLYDLEEKDIQPPTSIEDEPPTSTQKEERGSLLFNANLI